MHPALQEILYLELETGSIVRKFEGHDQGQYVLRSCFGGATENFVLSGSAGEFCLAPRAVFSRAGAVG